MKEYIEKKALLDEICRDNCERAYDGACHNCRITETIADFPAAEVVSKTAFEQIVWERDTALRQLREDYGVGLGEKKRDVAEVRHGEWLRSDDDWYSLTAIRCSICGEEWCFETVDDVTLLNYNHCPNCGAKMDGGHENAVD